MKLVIVGCGRVGARLANLYSRSGHEVNVIDESEGASALLEPEFTGEFLRGVGLDVDVMREAGIEDADVCITCTDGDNTNLVVAQVARELFEVPCVVVRVFDPDRARFYKEKGLKVACPVALTVDLIHEMVSDFRGEGGE